MIPWNQTAYALAALLAVSGGGQTGAPVTPDPSQGAEVDTLAPQLRPDSAALVFRGDTLGYLYGSLGPFTATSRAVGVVDRLAALRREGVRPEEVRVVDLDGRVEVWAGETSVLAVTAQDSVGHGTTASATAEVLAAAVRVGLSGAVLTRSVRGLLLGLLWTALATAALYGFVRLMALWYPKLYGRIRDIREDRLPSLRIQNLEILSGERIEAGLLVLARASR